MKEFLRVMRWSMDFKYNMCMYGLAILFVKWAVLLLQGQDSMPIWDIFWMTIAGMLISLVQYFCFVFREPSPERSLLLPTVIWAASANAIIIAFSLWQNWFPGLAAWGYAVLIAVLNIGIFLMWIGVHVARKWDTEALNRSLRTFQQKT